VFAAGSQTIWLTPTRSPAASTRKTVSLETVETSIGPLKGIESRGCTLKPSSVSRTAVSAQSDGRAAQSGMGRSTRRPVACAGSDAVSRFVGNGCPGAVAASAVADGQATHTRSTARTRASRAGMDVSSPSGASSAFPSG
jgi:hypothetical protein